MRRREFVAMGAMAGLGSLVAAAPASSDAERGAQSQFDDFMRRFAEDVLSQSPEQATHFGLDSGPRANLKRRLNDRSSGARARDGALWRHHLARLAKIDRTKLNDGLALTNYDCLVYVNELGAEGAKFFYGQNTLNDAVTESAAPYVISQQGGAYSTVPDFLDSQHRIDTQADADAYLARLDNFATCLADESSRIQYEAAHGVVLPDFLLATTIAQLKDLTTKPPSGSRLVTGLREKMQKAGIASDRSQTAVAMAERIVEQRIYPALRHQEETLQRIRPSARPDAGVWKLPDGDAYYAWTLKVGTTTLLSPAEIHRVGLEKTREVSARMDADLRKQGLTQGTVGERMAALSRDPRFLFPNNDKGRADFLAYARELVGKARAGLASQFNIHVGANVVVKAVPKEIEAGAATAYESHGSIDGSRAASYYVNLANASALPKWLLPTFTFHEALPGHALQGAFVIERHKLPLARIVIDFNAYAEGWALYAEQMADEIGLYDGDPFGRLGFLQEQLLRAGRLVVDTGLHAMRWSRDQSVNWLLENVGQPRQICTSEVDRYCSLPGQACGYMIGLAEIDRLRKKAQTALAARFDVRDFNDAVLTSGSLPLTLLADVINRFINGETMPN